MVGEGILVVTKARGAPNVACKCNVTDFVYLYIKTCFCPNYFFWKPSFENPNTTQSSLCGTHTI